MVTLVTLYGMANCDTVKKTRRWLRANNIDYRFHDYQKHGLDPRQLENWLEQLGDWKKLLNRRSLTWRELSEAERADLDNAKAISLMLQHPALIKRPVLETDSNLLVGFEEKAYQELFATTELWP